MAENASLYQVAQLGVESVPGTTLAATRKLAGLTVTPKPMAEVVSFKPAGYKFNTVAALSKEWAEHDITGPLSYTELPYLLSSLIKTVSPTGATADKTWTYTPSVSASDTRTTYTLEHGSAERARDFSYFILGGLTLTFNRAECTVKGTAISKAMVDGTSLASVSALDIVPVLPTQVSVYLADTAAGLAGASALDRAFEVVWNLNNLSGPVWPLNASVSGFAAHVDTMPEATGSFKMAVDATGMGPLTNLRAGSTKFLRVKAVGASLGSSTYTLTVDTAMKIKNINSLADQEGVYAIGWDFDTAYDSTWTKGTEIIVVTSLTAL
jgi:hypothetical protein